MFKTYSISQARANLPSVIQEAATEDIFITINGKQEAVITNANNYRSLIATLEVMSDPELMKNIKEAEKDIKAGRIHTWENVKKELKIK